MLIYKFDFSKKNKDNFELTVEFLSKEASLCVVKCFMNFVSKLLFFWSKYS